MAETANPKSAEELSPKSAASSPKGASPPAVDPVGAGGQAAPLDADDEALVVGEVRLFLGVSAVEGINHSDTRIPRARRRRCLRVFLNTDARMAVLITPTRPAVSIACRRRRWCGMG